MKIVICGAGQVGFNIARHLAMEGNDVIVIDTSPELIRRINDNLDAQGVVGHASRPDVLERAGIGDADMIIAVTQTDEVNMVACQVAHSLFEVPLKIARIREQSYLDPAWSNLFSRDHLPIDVIISPEVEVARAIIRRLKVPGSFEMIPLADDKVRLIGVRCDAHCPLINTPIKQLTQLFPDLNIVIVGLLRRGRAGAADRRGRAAGRRRRLLRRRDRPGDAGDGRVRLRGAGGAAPADLRRRQHRAAAGPGNRGASSPGITVKIIEARRRAGGDGRQPAERHGRAARRRPRSGHPARRRASPPPIPSSPSPTTTRPTSWPRCWPSGTAPIGPSRC